MVVGAPSWTRYIKLFILFPCFNYIIVGGEFLIFGTIKARSKDIGYVHGTGVGMVLESVVNPTHLKLLMLCILSMLLLLKHHRRPVM